MLITTSEYSSMGFPAVSGGKYPFGKEPVNQGKGNPVGHQVLRLIRGFRFLSGVSSSIPGSNISFCCSHKPQTPFRIDGIPAYNKPFY